MVTVLRLLSVSTRWCITVTVISCICTTSAAGQTWRIVPQVVVREVYSDNVELAVPALARNDFYSDITTGLLLERLGPRLSFLLDYRLRSYFYSTESRLNNSQNFLSSRATLELIDNWIFVDARANVTQQNRSAFGAQVAADGSSANSNQTEIKTYQLSPYVRGTLSDRAIYQFRFNGSESRAAEENVANTRTSEWLGLVASAPAAGRLGWLLDGSAQTVQNDDIGKRKNNRIRASLVYQLIPTLTVSAISGYEENSLLGPDLSGGSSNGLGMEWNPSPRTKLIALGQRRFFGNGHELSLTHRTALTSWRFSSSRDIVLSENIAATANQISVTELISDILASSIPDPAARSTAVGQRLGQTGIPVTSASSSGFVTSRPILTRRQDASLAILGVRSTITLTLTRRDQRGLGNPATIGDSFDLSDDIRQTSINGSWIYRLTPLSSLTLAISKSKREGSNSSGLESEQRVQSLYLNTSLGPHTTASIGIRHDQFDSTVANSYREKSLTGSLSFRF